MKKFFAPFLCEKNVSAPLSMVPARVPIPNTFSPIPKINKESAQKQYLVKKAFFHGKRKKTNENTQNDTNIYVKCVIQICPAPPPPGQLWGHHFFFEKISDFPAPGPPKKVIIHTMGPTFLVIFPGMRTNIKMWGHLSGGVGTYDTAHKY